MDLVVLVLSKDPTSPYLMHFLKSDVTFKTLEIICAIFSKSPLPKDFLSQYVCYCTDSCLKTKESPIQVIDSILCLFVSEFLIVLLYFQTRLARLICTFIQAIIRKNPSALNPVVVEIQSFCLSYPNLKEATAVYSSVKALENN